MARTYLSTHGDLRLGYFYLLDCDHDFDPGFWEVKGEIDIIVQRSRKAISPDGEWLRVETDVGLFPMEPEVIRDCQTLPDHVTQVWWKELTVIASNDPPGPILQTSIDDGCILVRTDIREGLNSAGFTGSDFSAVTFVTQSGTRLGHSEHPDTKYPMWYLKCRGRLRLRSLTTEGRPNKCPTCQYEPVICPTCTLYTFDCPTCSEELLRGGGQKPPFGEHSIVWEGRSSRQYVQIMEGETWDGSDFCHVASCDPQAPRPWVHTYQFVTRRVVDWMLARHVAPFAAIPIAVDVSRMSKEQLDKLDRAKVIPAM